MPQIFDDDSRNTIRKALLENGFNSIKKHGLKKTSISNITKQSGIATGTFYNFFKTKEEFVYQIIVYKREQLKSKFLELANNNKINRVEFQKYLNMALTEDYNLFMFLDDSEMAQLQSRWPEEYWKNKVNDEKTTEWILSYLYPLKENFDWKVAANLIKSLNIIVYSKVRLHEDSFNETLNVLIESVLDYIFEKELL